MAYTPTPSEQDDAAFSVGTDHVSPAGYLLDDTGTDSVDEGDIGVARMSSDRIAYSRVQDGHNAAQGATTDAAVTTNTTGTISGKLRGLVAILADVWNSTLQALRVTTGGVVIVSDSYTRPANATGYSNNDAISDSTSSPTALEFTGCVATNGGGGIITNIALAVDANVAAMDPTLFLFNAAPTPINDNATFAISYAEVTTLVAVIPMSAARFTTNGGGGAAGNLVWFLPRNNTANTNQPPQYGFQCAGGSTSLWGLLRTEVAFTPISGMTLTTILTIERKT